MKRLSFSALMIVIAICAILAFILIPGVALAAETPDTFVVNVPTAGGTAAWTNTKDYVTLNLKRLEVFQNGFAAGTVTVTRVRSTRTNTVQTLVCTSGAASSNLTADFYVFKNDVLVFTPTPSTGMYCEVTGLWSP